MNDANAMNSGHDNSVDLGVPKDDRLSTVQTDNPTAMARLLTLYARPGQTVADVTYGKGVFWRNVDPSVYDFRPSDLMTGVDFTALPYEDESLDLLVLDPPYRYTPAKNQAHVTDDRYRLKASAPTNTEGVVQLYIAGMTEAKRVLKHGGFLFVKCQDTVQDGKNIWVHCRLIAEAEALGYACRDLCVVSNGRAPSTRWAFQRHLRKSHSYFLVFRKGGHFPFGMPSVERRDPVKRESQMQTVLEMGPADD